MQEALVSVASSSPRKVFVGGDRRKFRLRKANFVRGSVTSRYRDLGTHVCATERLRCRHLGTQFCMLVTSLLVARVHSGLRMRSHYRRISTDTVERPTI